MTEEQKTIICHLLDLSYDQGFRFFSLGQVAQHVGKKQEDLYDPNTETGILWPFDSRSGDSLSGYLHFIRSGDNYCAGIPRECRGDLEHWSNYQE